MAPAETRSVRRQRARGVAVAGPLVVLMFLGVRAVAPQWALAPELGDWRWDAAWAGLAAGALLTLLLVSRDPAHRSQLGGGADQTRNRAGDRPASGRARAT